jgi:hypothetical protein
VKKYFPTFQVRPMNFQILHYREFEGRIRLEFYDLMDKYHSLKKKEDMMIEAREGKESRKDILLQAKSNNTITKLGDIELTMIEVEDATNTNYERNIRTIEQKRDKKIKDAQAECERKIRDAENEYERVSGIYDDQKKQSVARTKREYEVKRRTLIAKGESIEAERTLVVRTAGEITLEKQKYDLLKQLNSVISRISISRSQCPKGTIFDTPMLTLPEPLPSRNTSPATSKPPTPPPTPPPEPVAPVQPAVMGKYGMPLWLENMGEANLVLREQAFREDAEARKLADEEENEKKQEALARRATYERELAERRKRNEEYKKQKASVSE